MTKALYISLIATLILGGVALALRLMPAPDLLSDRTVRRYGLHEGLELVAMADGQGGAYHAVVDAKGRLLFNIPLRGCLLDVRFREGRLRFREKATGREGFIDSHGTITFTSAGQRSPKPREQATGSDIAVPKVAEGEQKPADGHRQQGQGQPVPAADLRAMARSNPFYAEAAKVLSGKLAENDAKRRHTILNYCEHFRSAYDTKDIDFLRQVFSDHALIIVGNVARQADGKAGAAPADKRIDYYLHTKHDYLTRLERVFAANKVINVRFSDFRIMRHPTVDGIYGVSLRQRYRSDRYADDGYLFLLWDFRNPAMPLIHVRTWQPAASVGNASDVISITDFNLQ